MLTERKIQNTLGRLGTSLSLTSPLRASSVSVTKQQQAVGPSTGAAQLALKMLTLHVSSEGSKKKMLKTTEWTSRPRSEPPEFAQDISWVSRTLGQEECGCGLSLENTGPWRPNGILLC